MTSWSQPHRILSQVHVFCSSFTSILQLYESQCAQPGNRTCKTPDIRLDTLTTTITGIANINGYHQLGLLTSKKCADFLMSLSKVVKSEH